MILINLGFRQKPKFVKISIGFVKFAKVPKVVKNQSGKIPTILEKIKICKNHQVSKIIHLVVLIEICIVLYFCMYCVLTEHLAECERLKYFQSAKWSKVKIKGVPSSFFGLPFLYLPNVLTHEPNEFIHVRVVNKLSKFQFPIQRLSDLVLTYSVGKGDCQIVPPSGGNLLSVTLWCLHPGHSNSSTHLLYNFANYIQYNQFGKEHFFVRAKGAFQGPDLAVPYRAF